MQSCTARRTRRSGSEVSYYYNEWFSYPTSFAQRLEQVRLPSQVGNLCEWNCVPDYWAGTATRWYGAIGFDPSTGVYSAHRNGANILFVDGHVRWYAGEPPPMWKADWNSYQISARPDY